MKLDNIIVTVFEINWKSEVPGL